MKQERTPDKLYKQRGNNEHLKYHPRANCVGRVLFRLVSVPGSQAEPTTIVAGVRTSALNVFAQVLLSVGLVGLACHAVWLFLAA